MLQISEHNSCKAIAIWYHNRAHLILNPIRAKDLSIERQLRSLLDPPTLPSAMVLRGGTDWIANVGNRQVTAVFFVLNELS